MSSFLRTLAIAVTLVVTSAGIVSAQRGSRGTMGVPRVTTTPPPAPAPSPSSASGRGVMVVPAHPSPTGPRGGDLPRVTTRQGSGYGRSYRYRSGYGPGSGYTAGSSYSGGGSSYSGGSGVGIGFGDGGGHRFEPGTSRRWRPGYTTPGYGFGCSIGCVRIGVGGRTGRFFGSFSIGYPFAIPIYVPYFYSTTVERYVEPAAESYYEPEPSRAASKLIVIGAASGGGGDALTVETIADSVRLQWLGAGRPAREVKLFVADSAQQPLASRSASPSAPVATFEIATLSAPVAYAGVTVTFADGVTSTTLVPYRGNRSR